MAEEVPLQTDNDSEMLEALYAIKGWVGDGSPKNDVGVLAVGGEAPLKACKEYRWYNRRR